MRSRWSGREREKETFEDLNFKLLAKELEEEDKTKSTKKIEKELGDEVITLSGDTNYHILVTIWNLLIPRNSYIFIIIYFFKEKQKMRYWIG